MISSTRPTRPVQSAQSTRSTDQPASKLTTWLLLSNSRDREMVDLLVPDASGRSRIVAAVLYLDALESLPNGAEIQSQLRAGFAVELAVGEVA